MNTAIIVAAGTGSRFGGNTPKQYLDLAGKPVIHHTIEAFESCRIIHEIILVVAQDRLDFVGSDLGSYSKVKSVIAGGESRSESVFAGLQQASTKGIIAVHDGARPLVSDEEITQTVAAAERDGAACLVMQVTDTIKSTDQGIITGTVERVNLRRAVTPQCFRHDILTRAFGAADYRSATDESMLVERLGIRITAVEGKSTNIKITGPEDLRFAEALLR